jgi:AraC family transcriptional regulator
MSERDEIKNPESSEFEKWAGIEVQDFSMVPEGMEYLILKDGLYAVCVPK